MRFLVIASVVLGSAEAWWDAGHMIIGAVARQHLMAMKREDVVTKVDHVLSYQQLDYPHVSALVTAPIWLDHVSCWKDGFRASHLCTGFSRYDNLQIFKPFHSSPVNYCPPSSVTNEFCPNGPTNLSDEKILEAASAVPGAYTAMDTITKTMIQSLSPTYKFEEQEYGSPFMYDLNLRLFMHVFGDVHNPVHMCSSVSPLTGNAPDKTGIYLSANYTVEGCWSDGTADMHSLWDGNFGDYCVAWPQFTEEDALAEAKQLMTKFPVESVSNPTATFQEVLVESYKAALTNVYGYGFDFGSALPFVPSTEYVDANKEFVRKQLTIAGYRLANYLSIFMDDMPDQILNFVDLKFIDSAAVPKSAVHLLIATILFFVFC